MPRVQSLRSLHVANRPPDRARWENRCKECNGVLASNNSFSEVPVAAALSPTAAFLFANLLSGLHRFSSGSHFGGGCKQWLVRPPATARPRFRRDASG